MDTTSASRAVRMHRFAIRVLSRVGLCAGLPLSFFSWAYVRQGSIFGRMVLRGYRFGVFVRQAFQFSA